MSAPVVVKVIARNLADDGRILAPGGGWSRPIETDAAGLQTWLQHFAALPGFETEEADARLIVTVRGRQLIVRRAGGRLGTEEHGTFVAGNLEEIQALFLTAQSPAASATAPEEAAPIELPRKRARDRVQQWVLAGLLTILVAVGWWTSRPETPEGVEWIGNADEVRVILNSAGGTYATDDEKLVLDAATGRLKATNPEGQETLDVTVRVGRRAGIPVLVTTTGVVLEVPANNRLRIDATDYARVSR
jgi:hypothetical protein